MKRCDCSQRCHLTQTGLLDPENAGYRCPCCGKLWHKWGLSDEYLKKIKSMVKSYRYTVKKEWAEVWISDKKWKEMIDK